MRHAEMTALAVLGALAKIQRGTAADVHQAGEGFQLKSCHKYLVEWQNSGDIHVGDWIQRGSMMAAVWFFGPGENVPMPKRAVHPVAMSARKRELISLGIAARRARINKLPALERILCPDLGKLPMVPFARPA